MIVTTLIDGALLHEAAPATPFTELCMWAAPITSACVEFEIATTREVAAFIAQTAVESQGFTRLSENMNYASPDHVRETFGKARFPTTAFAAAYTHAPEKLANYVYANRFGNGDVASGDGWRYRGGGLIGLTFHDNYMAFGLTQGMAAPEAADYVRTRGGAAMSAGWYWQSHKLNRFADTPGVEDETKVINGGENGLSARRTAFDAVIAELLKRGA